MVPTSGLVVAVKTCVAARRISVVDPSLTRTLSVLTLKCAANRLGELADLVRVAARLAPPSSRARRPSSTFFAGPDRVLVAADADHALPTAWRSASKADHTLFSRPRPQTLLVSAAPAPMPTVWTKLLVV